MFTLYANFKGGTGKSTVVFNMGLWLAARGKAVTVCDLDPQRTVSDVAEIRTEMGYVPPLTITHELPGKSGARGEWLADVGLSDTDAMRAAIRAAGRIVVPVTPSQADIWATQHFLAIVEEERATGKRPQVLGFVNRADPHPRSRENAETRAALRLLPGIKPLGPKLVQRLAFRRSFSEGLAVFELEPGGKAAKELDDLARAIHG
jgi:chromosome partitioning protein